MIVDLHNHTTLCNHASGGVLEYAAAAFNQGCKFYGFSDHAPMKFDEKYRMRFDEMPKYRQMVAEAAAEFAGKMEILFGYEVDFLEGFMDERVLGESCDYLIGSVHFLGGWGFDNPEFIGEYKNRDIDAIWRDYFAAVKASVECGKFDIVGHIDLLKIFNFRPKTEIKTLATPVIKAIKRADMVVELNSAGYRKPVGELYPGDEILELLREFDIKITLSSDAHAVSQVGQNMDKTIAKAHRYGFSEVAIFKNRDRKMIKF